MLKTIYNSIFGNYNEKYIQELQKTVDKINQKEEEYQKLSEEEFLKNTDKFKQRFKNGEKLDDLLVEAFATVKNASRRLCAKKHSFVLGKKEILWEIIPYDVQQIGGIILHQGNIAEMKTGEGKTFVCVAPLYLNALTEQGCHLVTVNEYLAERDASWMSQIFNYLSLSVGIIKHGQHSAEKKEQYACDITYGTNNEFGFDFLRENMAISTEEQVMRKLNFAIVDEVDSILIDEARTPLIISAPAEEATGKYQEYSELVKKLEKDTHYNLDEKDRAVTLTEEGIKKMEELLNIENIYTEKGFEEVHHIEASLKAQALFKKDTDYIVKDNEIIIVDEFTGRLMPGRRYSHGLHQAIEAKENVRIKQQSRTLASITFQNYFRLYNKLSGMTGTAMTEAKEFAEIYDLDTFVIPTNKPVQRNDKPDAVFKNIQGKYQAIVNRIKQAYEQGQPVLIGTISIEKSELLSQFLFKENISHNILNAKQHEKEAEIIAKAGEKGTITIATNMAGRGTDIKLTEESMTAGGLLVMGTERHESRRIDNQLRGRSGRQGDPGESQFFVSMDDDLMRLFGSERMKKMMERLGIPDDMPIENKMVSNSIESAQTKVEVRNFEVRKHIIQYDDVMNKHRKIIYEQRNAILENDDIKEMITELINKYITKIIENHTNGIKPQLWPYAEILNSLKQIGDVSLPEKDFFENQENLSIKKLSEICIEKFINFYEDKEKQLANSDLLRQAEKSIYLKNIDKFWMEHIDEMTKLRETVSLRAYANKNPLFEYRHEAFTSFKTMMYDISINTIKELFLIEIEESPIEINSIRPDLNIMKTNEEEIESELQSSHIIPEDPAVKVYRVQEPEQVKKVGRNEPCSCGSGKKYKKCCGK